MSEISREIRTKIEEQVTKELTERLVYYALKKARRLYWRGIINGQMPGGKEAEDLVAAAFEKIFLGKRTWDFKAQPDLYSFMTTVLDSDISHLAESWENTKVQIISAIHPTTNEEGDFDFLDITPGDSKTPEQHLLNSQREKEQEAFVFELHEFLASDAQLQKAVEFIFDGIEKPADIASRLGIAPKEMYNLTKRLKRRLTDFYKQKVTSTKIQTHVSG